MPSWEYEDCQNVGRRRLLEEERLYREQRYAEEHRTLPMRKEQHYYENRDKDKVLKDYRVSDDYYRRSQEEYYDGKTNMDRYYDTLENIRTSPVKFRHDGGRDRRLHNDGYNDYRYSYQDPRELDVRYMKKYDTYCSDDRENDDRYYRDYHRRKVGRNYETEVRPPSMEKRYSDQDVQDYRTDPYKDRKRSDYEQRDYRRIKDHYTRLEDVGSSRYPEASNSRCRPFEKDSVDYKRDKTEPKPAGNSKRTATRHYDFLPLDCDSVDVIEDQVLVDHYVEDLKYDRSRSLDFEAEPTTSCKRMAYDFEYNPPEEIDLYLNNDDLEEDYMDRNAMDDQYRGCDEVKNTDKRTKLKRDQYGSSWEDQRTIDLGHDPHYRPERSDGYDEFNGPENQSSSNGPTTYVDYNDHGVDSSAGKTQSNDLPAHSKAELASSTNSMKRNSIYRRTAPSTLRRSEFVQNRRKKQGIFIICFNMGNFPTFRAHAHGSLYSSVRGPGSSFSRELYSLCVLL